MKIAVTELDLVMLAADRVYQRCRKNNPNHMSIPDSGESAFGWFVEELKKIKEQCRNAETS